MLALISVLPTPPSTKAWTTTTNPSSFSQDAVNQDLLAAFGKSLQDNPSTFITNTAAQPKPSSKGKNLEEALRDAQREKQIGPTTHGK